LQSYCYRSGSMICRSVTVVSPAKTVKPIEIPFGLRTWVSPWNHVLDEGADPPWEAAILRGGTAVRCKVWGWAAMSCTKIAEPIEMPFGFGLWWDQQSTLSGGGAHCCHLANTTEPPMCNGDTACCQITLTSCLLLSQRAI